MGLWWQRIKAIPDNNNLGLDVVADETRLSRHSTLSRFAYFTCHQAKLAAGMVVACAGFGKAHVGHV